MSVAASSAAGRPDLSSLVRAEIQVREGTLGRGDLPSLCQGGRGWQIFKLLYWGPAAVATRTNTSAPQGVSSARGLRLRLDPGMRASVPRGSGV